MDIRNFFKRPRLEANTEPSTVAVPSDADAADQLVAAETEAGTSTASASLSEIVIDATVREFDIGRYVQASGIEISMSAEQKLEIFRKAWVPNEDHEFNKANGRSFRYEWLQTYNPWLAYSEITEGGSLQILSSFQAKIHDAARSHANSEWHVNSVSEGSSLMDIANKKKQSISNVLSQNRLEKITKNRQVLGSIVRTIVFCGTHDLALRGKKSTDGNFKDLLQLQVQSGDLVLKKHLEEGAKNAKYTSVRTEHEIIEMCENIIADEIVSRANASKSFSILADETCDIAGVEQLSLGVRFCVFENKELKIF